ncbi:formate dehydrogenase subunit alpha [Bordetella tumulicola]|uniref:formate dehydrogenase subunit alpha n=1 Tax=Bordetella tumulicola TaxID=1649133 RepID=UPI0039EE693A
MLLTKKTAAASDNAAESNFVQSLRRGLSQALPTMDRRSFLRRSGIGVGAGLAAAPLALVRRADAAETQEILVGKTKTSVRRTVCTHCSVGCAVDAVVENGVWVRQEPVFDSPINLGAHCAKGAAVREHGHGEHRLRYPMKLVNGKYERISWDTALTEISAQLMKLSKESGPDSVYWIGSSKHNNEQSYLFRKFVSYFGSNNCDHQARICHSTTVAGVANTWGYGAMTNSYNDMQNSKVALYIGSNAAEAHPVSMLHMLHAKETGCKMIVVDPRFTRTAAKADRHVRIRSGTDVAFLFGLLYHIFKNGWEDQAYIDARVYGMDQVKADVLEKWTPEKVLDVCGVDEDTMFSVAKTMHENRPGTLVWCMGQTQHSIGNAMVRASCIVQLALGNIGRSGGGANIFRGHDNVQGATDVGPNPDSLPGYYGLTEGSWKHFANAWGVDYEWIKSRYASPELMTKPGITVSRWIDGVLEDPEVLDQPTNLKAVIYWGHAPNSQTRGLEMKRAMDKLDLLVVVDPYPSATAAMAAMPGKPEDLNPNRAVYLLPAATQFETSGSCTASNRSLQWREKVIEPLWESRSDHMIMYQLAEKLGFGKEFVKNYELQKVKGMDEPVIEDVLREMNACCWTIGYTGQSPERLKAHMRNMHVFDVKTLRAKGGKDAETGYDLTGDYFGLPWPCWGTPEMKHPGTANLYDTSLNVMDGGGNFRANFGVERDGVSLLAEDGSHSKGADLTTGYPEFDHVLLKKLGWWNELTDAEKKAADGKNWKTDSSGGIIRVVMKNHGCYPFGNAKARAVVWNFPDPIPQHREPIYGTRPDLVAKYPSHKDLKTFWRMPTLYTSLQQKNVADKLYEKFPIILTSGRLVEYEGGGDETRSNPWLAELQQEAFVEINPKAAADRGIQNGDRVWLQTPTGARLNVQALVTERVGPDTAFMPFHFAGHWQGVDMLASYPEGAAPIVRGEAVNTGTTYGYDSVTMMQETKTTICNIAKA